MSDEQIAKAEGERQKAALAYILKAIVNDPAIPYPTKINSVIALGSASCAVIAVQPIPFADIFILTPVQMVMVYYLNKIIMGDDVKIDTATLLKTLAAVAGWGVVAQQLILGLYKTVLPFLGAITTIPLVYAATSAIGYAAVKLLEMKAQNKALDVDNLSATQKAELEKIAKQAKKDAKKHKQSLDELKSLLANAKKDAQKFHEYQEKSEQLEKQNQALMTQMAQHQKRFDDKFAQLKQEYQDLNEEQLTLLLQNEPLSQENQTLIQEVSALKQQLTNLQNELSQQRQKKYDFLQKRMKIYVNIVFEKNAFDEFVSLTDKDAIDAEKQIGYLNHTPDKASFRCKIQGTDILEIGFSSQGRMYVKRIGGKYHIYKIGNKATQANDIKYLKSL